MGARNGQSVFDIVTNGWKRKVISMNGSGTPAVTIPAEFAEEHGVETGDDVAVTVSETDGGVLELHFE